MATIDDQIAAVEDEIARTPYNKATQHHIGKLKAKLARLKEEQRRRQMKSRGGGVSYAVRKSGHATVGLVGFPSVGKSTLINAITDAKSTVASYAFTTVDIVPGIMHYKDAKVQILDMPGLIHGASKGRGRGREVLSVARTCDLLLLMIDVFETNVNVLVEELYSAGMRINEGRPDVVLTKKRRGGVEVHTTVPLTKIDIDTVEDMVREFGHLSADIVIRDDVTQDQLIDALVGNRIYVPALLVLNKIDLVGNSYLREIRERFPGWNVIPISATKGDGLTNLKEEVYNALHFIRVYLKPQGQEADMNEPLVVREGATVGSVCDILHREFRSKFRFAYVWGESGKFPGQTVGVNHVLKDRDMLTIVVRKS